MLKRLDIIFVNVALLLDVVFPKEWGNGPTTAVLGVEETDLHYNTPRIRLRKKISESLEIFWIPLVQVESVSSRKISGTLTSSPRLDKLSRLRGQGVLELKCAFRLDKSRRVDSRVV
jgi:hypothetical protein